jgi:hypothetical protein
MGEGKWREREGRKPQRKWNGDGQRVYDKVKKGKPPMELTCGSYRCAKKSCGCSICYHPKRIDLVKALHQY